MSKIEAHKEVKEPGKKIRYQRDKDREKVRGIFRFNEVPGGSMSFVFKAYKEDPVERYDMVDGQVYTIPLGVARHLNKNGFYPEYEYLAGEAGFQTGFGASMGGSSAQGMKIGRKIHRFNFQSLEFVDLDDIGENQSKLVTVETGF